MHGFPLIPKTTPRLGDAWFDTTHETGRFMLTVMSGISELERDLIRKRCQAGI
jgi:DNA invertase Pin-like site-specific DNA recombinase